MLKRCVLCQGQFEARSTRRRFCSDGCRNRYHRHGVSKLTKADVVQLKEAQQALQHASVVLDTMATLHPEVEPIGFLSTDAFNLTDRLTRRINIEIRHGAYDPTELRRNANERVVKRVPQDLRQGDTRADQAS